MNLNYKTLRQLRRAPRTRATELVKFRKEIIDGGLRDHWRWKSWVNHAPAAVYLLQAAEVLDDIIRHGADTDGVANATLYRHSRRRRNRLHVSGRRYTLPGAPMTTQLEKIFKERGFVETIKWIEERRGLPFDRKLQLSYLEAIDRGMLRSINWMKRLDPEIPCLSSLLRKTSGATDGERAVASQKLADLKREIFAVPVSSSALLYG